MKFSLRNKSAVVTGGGSGIGPAICLAIAEQGAMVHILELQVEHANETAGKNKSGRITHDNKNLRSTLVELGSTASRTKDTNFGAKHKSMVGRRGKKKTIIALGHKILIAAYHFIKEKMPYKGPGKDHLNNFGRDKLVPTIKTNGQLANLGAEAFQVV